MHELVKHLVFLHGFDEHMSYTLLDDTVPPRRTYSYEDYMCYRAANAYQIIKKTREQLRREHKVSKVCYDRDSSKPHI